ncbi:prepilin-type N-terminal cleavage/methylation domain-containing protein [Acidaminobacter sp. JC074]|uniref:PulJ/GspJ family protein n=1 Tax=Acidaminobacter sp. JC074 TaxID=2530199 RepID=UPI001F1142EC|nr:prepilin-type N-terminal cleavage/methylation domain-containing protein [Acidaminobacter sp. JC074]MCH4888801.1 prepilin-type N-terminal cleavage/methylation domain-containing protein [Acidaminobacter sp. JC074]
MKFFKNKYGFTLVEMIIVISVAAIVLTPFGMLMTAGLRNEVAIQRTIDADQTTQQTFIVLNEKIRKEGFSAVEDLGTHLAQANVLRVDDKIFFLNSNGYVYQDYNDTVLQTTTEVVLNEFVLSAIPSMITYEDILDRDAIEKTGYTTEQLNEIISLEIEFGIDTNNDNVIDDTYTYIYSKRN